jgi:hypothetical protein
MYIEVAMMLEAIPTQVVEESMIRRIYSHPYEKDLMEEW